MPISIHLAPPGTGRIHTSSVLKIEGLLQQKREILDRQASRPVEPYTFDQDNLYTLELPTKTNTR